MFHGSYWSVVCFIALTARQTACNYAKTITVENGTQAVFQCPIAEKDYPAWLGPLNGTQWLFNYVKSSQWRPDIGMDKISRLSWSEKERNLVLNPATFTDSGRYTCYNNGGDSLDVSLRVRERPLPPMVTLYKSFIETNSFAPLANCTTRGLWTRDIKVKWQFGDGAVEASSRLNVTEIAERKFSVMAEYSRAVSVADNGKSLTCTIEFATSSTPLSGTAVVRVLENTKCWDGQNTHGKLPTVSHTESGKLCQMWVDDSPHKKNRNYVESMFPEGSFKDAKNYCRDPGADGFFWCYTVNPDERWGRCIVPLCPVKPATPVVTILHQLVESDVPIPIAKCTTSGFRPQPLEVTWQIDGEPKESSTNLNVTQMANETTFSAISVYSRSVSRADNGKKLVCSVYHETLGNISAGANIIVMTRPELTLFHPLVERDISSPVAMCTTTGISTRDINVTWQFEYDVREQSTNVTFTQMRGEDTFSVKALYSRAVSMKDNGKTLKCIIKYDALKPPLAAEGTVIVLALKGTSSKPSVSWSLTTIFGIVGSVGGVMVAVVVGLIVRNLVRRRAHTVQEPTVSNRRKSSSSDEYQTIHEDTVVSGNTSARVYRKDKPQSSDVELKTMYLSPISS